MKTACPHDESAQAGQDACRPPSWGARVGQISLLGASVFFVAGANEAGILCWIQPYPEPLALLRQASFAYAVLGVLLGAAYGMLCEFTIARLPNFRRRRF